MHNPPVLVRLLREDSAAVGTNAAYGVSRLGEFFNLACLAGHLTRNVVNLFLLTVEIALTGIFVDLGVRAFIIRIHCLTSYAFDA